MIARICKRITIHQKSFFSYRNQPLPDSDVEAAGDASFVDAPERIECMFAPTFLPSVEASVFSCLFEDSAMMYC